LYVSRNEPLNRLPPDLVIMFTTPPLKWPNSAETHSEAMVVSWMARMTSIPRSKMRRSDQRRERQAQTGAPW
jgi:hypothetical protein